jgi:hypothetical protein
MKNIAVRDSNIKIEIMSLHPAVTNGGVRLKKSVPIYLIKNIFMILFLESYKYADFCMCEVHPKHCLPICESGTYDWFSFLLSLPCISAFFFQQ